MLLHNLLQFAQLLRQIGFAVHTGGLLDVVRAIKYVGLGSRDDFKHTLRTILVHRHEDFERFDEAFELFWRRHEAGSGPARPHRPPSTPGTTRAGRAA